MCDVILHHIKVVTVFILKRSIVDNHQNICASFHYSNLANVANYMSGDNFQTAVKSRTRVLTCRVTSTMQCDII